MTTTTTLSSLSSRLPRPALAVLVAAVAALAGCASNVPLDNKPATVETRNTTGTGSGTSGADAGGVASSSVTPVDLTRSTASSDANVPRVVYFDFDSYIVKDEYRPTVEGYSKLLSTNKQRNVQIEGHTDERGGREYNLALGQKRAEAVAKAMTLMGASQAQIEPVSFGKERPAVQGSDESAWAKNRRAEINGK